MRETTFIYALTEPGTRIIRYFGKADSPKSRRFAEHILNAYKGEKWRVSRWIRKLLRAGQCPDIHVLCEVPKDEFSRFERAFITLGHQHGFNLTNLTDGGEGTYGYKHTLATREKLSVQRRGEKHPMFGKKGERCHNFGKNPSLEARLKMSAAATGRKHTSETRAKISAANRGEKHPMFGKKPSLETKLKMSAAQKAQHAKKRDLLWQQ